MDEHTRLLEADRFLEGDTDFELGGVHFALRHVGPAHSAEDMAMLVREDGVLYLGSDEGLVRVTTLDGTWSAAGTRLTLDVTNLLIAGRTYRIDLTGFRDLGGTVVDAAHPYLADGFLDFTMAAPTGENCRDVLTAAEGTTVGGVTTWVIEDRQAVLDDGDDGRAASLPLKGALILDPQQAAPTAVVGASIRALQLVDEEPALRERVMSNAASFRAKMSASGFTIKPGIHPIVPVMIGGAPGVPDGEDARIAQRFAARLLDEGIYVIGFSFPVVPRGQARIRVQLSAAHEPEHVERAVSAFTKVGRELGLVGAG